MKSNNLSYLIQAAMIAALYVVLTFVANMFGLASGAVQIRLSEALTILPYFTPAAIPGLFVGCFLSNLLTGGIFIDVIVGSLTTLVAAVITFKLRKFKWIISVPPILGNAVIVPFVLIYGYGIQIPYWISFLTVGAGEVISCGILGMALFLLLEKKKEILFQQN